MAASVPEIILIIRNQLTMVYDIAKANGHNEITKELMLGVFINAMGNATGNLLMFTQDCCKELVLKHYKKL